MPRHDLDVISLMAGIGFAGLGLVALIGDGTAIHGRWTWPILLIAIGMAGLVASRRGTKP